MKKWLKIALFLLGVLVLGLAGLIVYIKSGKALGMSFVNGVYFFSILRFFLTCYKRMGGLGVN